MSEILFLNHSKSQCGVHEIGKRIYNLISPFLDIEYAEVPVNGLAEYIQVVSERNPSQIIYNYYPGTMLFLNKESLSIFPNQKHFGIIHDPLDPPFVASIEEMFDAWIIHDHTNPLPSANKFVTYRPIPRFNKTNYKSDSINIGSHGFNCSPWKMFGDIVNQIHSEFEEEVNININIPSATFAMGNDNFWQIEEWRSLITKPNIHLNVSNHYFETENELIEFLSKNDMNVYFYNPPGPHVGVGGSADLAVASQSALVVNDTYMYRHFHEALGFFNESHQLKGFLGNADKVKILYDEWCPEAIAMDYKRMLESL